MAYSGIFDAQHPLPYGWILCNGSAISRTTYSDLFAAIGTSYGTGDGSTTFNLPNYSGAFLRGTGNQTKNYNSTNITYTGPNVDNVGQSHATQVHNHSITDPMHSHTYWAPLGDKNADGGGDADRPFANNPDNAYNTSSVSTGITINNSTTSGGTITNTDETRPFNFGVYWIIKF